MNRRKDGQMFLLMTNPTLILFLNTVSLIFLFFSLALQTERGKGLVFHKVQSLSIERGMERSKLGLRNCKAKSQKQKKQKKSFC
jgi:hypothetical protein